MLAYREGCGSGTPEAERVTEEHLKVALGRRPRDWNFNLSRLGRD